MTQALHPLIFPFTSADEAATLAVVTGGEGVRLRTADGEEFTDGLSGLWCAQFGYGDGELLSALESALRAYSYGSAVGGVCPQPVLEFAATIASLVPLVTSQHERRVFLAPSASDANDVLLRLILRARASAGRTRAGVLRGGYHGSTGACAILRGAALPGFKTSLESTLCEQFRIMLPDPCFDRAALRGETFSAFERRFAFEVEECFASFGHELAAVWIEPVQGAGGVVPLTPAMAESLTNAAKEYGVWIVADEVVTGLWRTGSLWGVQRIGLRPDAIVFGKGITAGSFPLAGFVVTSEAVSYGPGERFPAGMTYGYHPGGAAAALAVLRRVTEPAYEAIAGSAARKLAAAVREGTAGWPRLRALRSTGCMVGLEFGRYSGGVLENAERTEQYVRSLALQARRAGLLLRAQQSSLALIPAISNDDEYYETIARTLSGLVGDDST